MLILYVTILGNRQTPSIPSWDLEPRETRHRDRKKKPGTSNAIKYLNVQGATPNLFEGYQGRLECIGQIKEVSEYPKSWN